MTGHVKALAGILAEHRNVYGQQAGRLCRCGVPDPFGQRQGNGSAAHRAHLAEILAAYVTEREAQAWDEGRAAATRRNPYRMDQEADR